MLGMNGFELFPPKQIRMIWAQLRAETSELAKFNRRLLFETINLGLNPDPKELRLHITMGRIKTPQSPAMQRSILETSLHTDLLPFDTLSLYKSVLQPHTLLEQIKL
jgi:2'-5' RNA ligase